jgi:hypothetical protein
LRGFAQSGKQISLIKRTRLPFREATNFEIRADISNPFNRTWISDPETDIGDQTRFGRVFSKYGGGRTIQLGARISFQPFPADIPARKTAVALRSAFAVFFRMDAGSEL